MVQKARKIESKEGACAAWFCDLLKARQGKNETAATRARTHLEQLGVRVEFSEAATEPTRSGDRTTRASHDGQ